MSAMKLLEGQQVDDDDDRNARIEELEEELAATKADLRKAQAFARDAQANAAAALQPLRRQLTPLYRALQSVFGELDAAGVPDAPGPAAASSVAYVGTADARVAAVWDAWKKRLPPSAGRVIDTLLVHGGLTAPQICVAAQMAKATLRDAITALNKAALLNKDGGRYSLKQL